jgi:predicted nuclease of predicted toxin-antitoxin system
MPHGSPVKKSCLLSVRMRFLADMGVSPRVVKWLSERNHDARHLAEENLHRLPDEKVFEKAAREKRTLLTFDLDFAEIVALSGSTEVSVVLFRIDNTKTEFVLARLASVLTKSGDLLSTGVIVIVEDSRHRIRRLPIRRTEED